MPNEPTFDIMIIQGALTDIGRRVADIEADISTINEMINGHARVEAVFAYRHDQAKDISDKLELAVDRIIEKGEDQLQATIEMIDKREIRLTESIAAHKEAMFREIALQHQTLKQSIDHLQKSLEAIGSNQQTNAKEVETVKKWLWTLAGGLITLSLIADKIWGLIQSAIG